MVRTRGDVRRRTIVGPSSIALILCALVAGCTAGDAGSVAPPSDPGATASATPLAPTDADPIAIEDLEGQLLFARAGGRFGDETIFVADVTGADERQLTPFGGSCCARWSPDGTKILLAAEAPDGRITTGIMDPDGSNLRLIPLPGPTTNLGPGAWSPDGRWIAFQLWDESDHRRDGIYVGRASDGGALRRVTTTEGEADIPADFSPDGDQLLFLRERVGEQSVGSVFVVDLDGGQPRRVTPPAMAVGWGGVRWSPDGKLILLPDARDRVDEGSLWTVRPDGSRLRELFTDDEGRYATSPVWSPDGRFIMFTLSASPADFSHPANEVFVIRRDGSGLTPVMGGNDHKRPSEWVRSP